jgi:hypothetical protein
MAITLTTFKNVDGIHQDIMNGSVYNGIVNFTFASGETQKLMLLEIPADTTIQIITSGLSIRPYDNTFSIRKLEGDSGSLVTGTPITTSPDAVRNLNRNITDSPVCIFSKDPTGVFNNDGLIIEDFDMINAERQNNFVIASKTILNGIERIAKPQTKFIYKFTRTTDTTSLNMEYRIVWVEYGA